MKGAMMREVGGEGDEFDLQIGMAEHGCYPGIGMGYSGIKHLHGR